MMKSRILIAFVLAVDVSALIVLAVLPAGALDEHLSTLLLLVGLATLAGARPVRIPTLRHEPFRSLLYTGIEWFPIVLCEEALNLP